MLWFLGIIFTCFFLEWFWFLDMFCQGEKDISALAPVPLHYSVLCPPWVGWHRAWWWQGNSRQRGYRQPRGEAAPTSAQILPFSSEGCSKSWRDEKSKWGQLGEWLKLFGLPVLAPSSLLTLYMCLEKLLRDARHRNMEEPVTGTPSVGGNSTLCMSRHRKGGRSYPPCNVYIFQDVSEVHTYRKWHIRAPKLE